MRWTQKHSPQKRFASQWHIFFFSAIWFRELCLLRKYPWYYRIAFESVSYLNLTWTRIGSWVHWKESSFFSGANFFIFFFFVMLFIKARLILAFDCQFPKFLIDNSIGLNESDVFFFFFAILRRATNFVQHQRLNLDVTSICWRKLIQNALSLFTGIVELYEWI